MKRIVLLSGGLDSATLLYRQKTDGRGEILALFFDIGQKSAERERKAARVISVEADVRLEEISLVDLFRHSKSVMLTGSGENITEAVRIGNHTEYKSGKTEIEFRNGVLIAAAVAIAGQFFPNDRVEISYGAIKTPDRFTDCSKEFVETCDKLACIGSHGQISVSAPFYEMGKDKVWRMAKALNVPTKLTWSCYDGGETPCGICPACLDRRILEGMYDHRSGKI